MKLKIVENEDTIKDDNEFLIGDCKDGSVALKMDLQKVMCIVKNTLYTFSRDVEFIKFLNNNSELLDNTIKTETMYIVETMAQIYCKEWMELKRVRKNFYKFKIEFEDLIALVIMKYVHIIMKEKMKKERDS